jgi:Filamentation induced by cAMP protein Fic-like, C-terminal domain
MKSDERILNDREFTQFVLDEARERLEERHRLQAQRYDLDKVTLRVSSKVRTKFRDQVLNPLIQAGFVEMRIADKPGSSIQKYRLTEKGKNILALSDPPY